MNQDKLFDDSDLGYEGEDDLFQEIENFEQAVVWGTDWTSETIVNQIKKENIDLFPKFQRRDAWNPRAKSKFIESLMLGLPIPQIILAEKKGQRGRYIVLDGKQRLLTLRQFFSTKKDDLFKPLTLSGLQILQNLNGETFQSMSLNPAYSQIVNQLSNHTIRTIVIRNWPNESFLYTVFLRLNTGSIKLSPQELRQALHPGPFIDFVDTYAIENENLKIMLNRKTPDFRMRDNEMIVRFYTIKYFIEDYRGNLKAAFDNTVETLNAQWEIANEQILQDADRFDRALGFVLDTFGRKNAFSKWNGNNFQNNFNRAVFDIFMFYLSDDFIYDSFTDNPQRIVEAFKNLCDSNDDFLSSLESTTKSMTNTILRLNTFGERIAEILGVKINVPVLRDETILLVESDNG